MKKFAKHILIIFLAIALTLSLVACDGGDPVRESTPNPITEGITDSEAVKFKFPFSFSSVDLQGNTVTDEDLGEKELFFAYLWAVW